MYIIYNITSAIATDTSKCFCDTIVIIMEKGKVKEMQSKILAYNCLMFAKNNKGFFQLRFLR